MTMAVSTLDLPSDDGVREDLVESNQNVRVLQPGESFARVEIDDSTRAEQLTLARNDSLAGGCQATKDGTRKDVSE
jgi:hypothetical protein